LYIVWKNESKSKILKLRQMSDVPVFFGKFVVVPLSELTAGFMRTKDDLDYSVHYTNMTRVLESDTIHVPYPVF
jgi:hypothetical protein